jgi:hypothetical protein
MRPRLFGLLVRSHGIAVLRELIDHMIGDRMSLTTPFPRREHTENRSASLKKQPNKRAAAHETKVRGVQLPFSKDAPKTAEIQKVLSMLVFGWTIIALGVTAMLWADGNVVFSRG